MGNYVLALDQGTTSSRAILFDREQNIVGMAQKEFTQFYPKEGWVEHDPMEIYSSQYACDDGGHRQERRGRRGNRRHRHHQPAGDRPSSGIKTPAVRSTTPSSGSAAAPRDICDDSGRARAGRTTSGKPPAWYSTPISRAPRSNGSWTTCEGARERAERGELLFGTVDSWLIWKLTEGAVHVTDYTNASRTMLYNIQDLDWDETAARRARTFPRPCCRRCAARSEVYGYAAHSRGARSPSPGIAGDQQAALFGQCCFAAGRGEEHLRHRLFPADEHGRDTPVTAKTACSPPSPSAWTGRCSTRWRAASSCGGAVIQWLRDELRFISESARCGVLRAPRCPTPAGSTSSPPLPGWARPTGICTRAAALWASPAAPGGSTSSARRRSPSPTRRCDLVEAMEQDTGIALDELQRGRRRLPRTAS